MMVVAGIGTAATPSRRLVDEIPPLNLEEDIPQRLGDWVIDRAIAPILPAPDVQERLNRLYNSILTRTYTRPITTDRLMLVIAYGADQADRTTLAHLPEACYSSQGFQISGKRIAKLGLGAREFDVVQLETRRGSRMEPVTYWTTVGTEAVVNEAARRWARARYSMRGLIPDGMLVRVSTLDPNAARAFELHAGFISALRTGVSPATAQRVFGSFA